MPKLRYIVHNKIEYWGFRLALTIMKSLPKQLSRAIMLGLFQLVGYRIGIRREVARLQMSKVLTDLTTTQIRSLLRSMYRNMALSTYESLLLTNEEILSISSEDSIIHAKEALELGKGALIATAHFGSWEAARVLPSFGIPLAVVAKTQRNIYFDDYNNRVRESNGVVVINMKKALRGITEQLRLNKMVAVLVDQNAGSKGLVMDFLGYPASHWKGVAKMSLRLKVPIVPTFALRTPEDKLIFRFEPMIYHPDWEDSEENILHVMHEIDTILESYIRKYPDQWFWVHKRWKHSFDMFKESI